MLRLKHDHLGFDSFVKHVPTLTSLEQNAVAKHGLVRLAERSAASQLFGPSEGRILSGSATNGGRKLQFSEVIAGSVPDRFVVLTALPGQCGARLGRWLS